jgi:hypothetical protein
MKRFIEGLDRSQTTLLPNCIDEYVNEDNPVRAVDAFVDMLDLAALGSTSNPRQRAAPGTIRQQCSSSTFTAISTRCNRRAGSSANARAILS